MKLTARRVMLPLIALSVLGLTLQQTMAALRASGSWRAPTRVPKVRPEDPYSRVDNVFAQNHPEPVAEKLRNPFAFGNARPAPTGGGKPVAYKPPPPPPPPPKPMLTSIVWDNDPRATVRYDGRDFSVRVNSLFADFRVKSITSNEVVLERGGETIVLSLRPKGD